jgi:hypothetical protein
MQTMNAETKVKPASLSAAMAKAFAEIEGATKAALNPHFGKKYADVGAVIDAIKPALIKHGLFFTQRNQPSDDGVIVETVLHHEGGEEMNLGSLFVPADKRDAQKFGSALTYCRRYALMTAFGVPAEDDDGNAAARSTPAKANEAAKPPIADEQRDLIQTLAPAAGKTVQGICQAYRVQSLKELTHAQGDNIINRLKADAKEPANA